MNAVDLEQAVRILIDLNHRDRAAQAAAALPDDLPAADLLRAADGAQQVARALAVRRRQRSAESSGGYDPHDMQSLYS